MHNIDTIHNKGGIISKDRVIIEDNREVITFSIDVIDNNPNTKSMEHSRKIIRFNNKIPGFSINELKYKLFSSDNTLRRLVPYYVGHELILLDKDLCYNLDQLHYTDRVRVRNINANKDKKEFIMDFRDYIKLTLGQIIGTRLADRHYYYFFESIIKNKYKKRWVRLQQDINCINKFDDLDIIITMNYGDIIDFNNNISYDIKGLSKEDFKSDYEQLIDLFNIGNKDNTDNNRFRILINNIKVSIPGLDYNNKNNDKDLITCYILEQVEERLRYNITAMHNQRICRGLK